MAFDRISDGGGSGGGGGVERGAEWLVDRKRTVPDWYKRAQAIQARTETLQRELRGHATLGRYSEEGAVPCGVAHRVGLRWVGSAHPPASQRRVRRRRARLHPVVQARAR